ncbi:MAG: glutathionylspermidine synthase family protein [Candidatus Sericytochromatia bacterium]
MKELSKSYKELMQWMSKNPEEVIKNRQEFQERVIKKRCFYGDSAMPTTLMPLFLKQKSLQSIKYACEVADTIIERTIDLYFKDEYVREYFAYHPPIPKEWINTPTGYKKNTVINRLDILFDGKNIKFIEFNTDNPGGRGWTDIYEELYRENNMYKGLIEDFSVKSDRSVVNGEFEAIMACFKEMKFKEPPRLALVDFGSTGSRGDIEIIRDYFIEKGVEANIIDARDFEYRNGKLYSNGVHFNMIHRGLRAEFFLKYPKELKDFHKGIQNKAACMVNSFRAVVGSEKSMLSFISNPSNSHYFTEEQNKVIKKHIPWTRKFDETITMSKEGEEVTLKTYMVKKRDELVIKPATGAGGYGVMVGKTTDPMKWNDIIDAYSGDPGWIVQEYTEIPTIKLPVIRKNKIVFENKFLNISPYVFNGKYVGSLGRVSDKDVINVSSGGGIIPIFTVKENIGSSEDSINVSVKAD